MTLYRNMYGYVGNNPMVFVDPDGLFEDCPGATVMNNQCVLPPPPPPVDCTVLISQLFNPACGGGMPQGPTITAALPTPQKPSPGRPPAPSVVDQVKGLFGYDKNDPRPSCFAFAMRSTLDHMNPVSPDVSGRRMQLEQRIRS